MKESNAPDFSPIIDVAINGFATVAIIIILIFLVRIILKIKDKNNK